MVALSVWRHPRPQGAEGRCIGRTDLPVDPRKAKRLAHRVRRHVRQNRWPRVVHTSPLRRCADVGRWLARWGFEHRVDDRLLELDFGRWDGLHWRDVPREAFDAWTADFMCHAPGGGEPLQALMARCGDFLGSCSAPVCVVGHAGWINAARLVAAGRAGVLAAEWPAPVGYAAEVALDSSAGGAESQ